MRNSETEALTWASRAWSAADCWGVVSVRVLFFFTGGGGCGGAEGDALWLSIFSLTRRVFWAFDAPLCPTSLSVSKPFDDASERDCAS
jgi:hypothetical protein